ncbi:hypothetical protein GCM10011390_44410 [Aureimonas endophytica]|uniref:Uncharacterized protein n=1 Tax=Aureimonas endophytica TaxID=2027858 RepID=A0A917EAW8_9HYPH|nr:hypothetical protein [Aureimonas endophytica]GGE20277.1 hypothetical protein GCM10011390_44410 [Aureimonas endophytica]
MSDINNVLKALAGAAQDLHAKTQALDILVRALYVERAVAKGLFPAEAEEEVLALVEGIAASEADDPDVAGQFLSGVQRALADFGQALREQLEEARYTPE